MIMAVEDVRQQWEESVKSLSQERREQLQAELTALGERAEKMPDGQVRSEFDDFMEKLPQAMRTNLRNIIDVDNLTPEQLRGLVIGGATDGGLDRLAFAMRGDTEANPIEWQKMRDNPHDRMPWEEAHRSELGQLSHNIPDEKERQKGGHDR